MESNIQCPYRTVRQFVKEYPFLSEASIRWWIFKSDKFKKQCVKKLGRKVLLNAPAVLSFIENEEGGEK